MEAHLRRIVELSMGSTPEDMLKASLDICIQVSGARGGSILGEEGNSLQFLFSDVPELIGVRVPLDSIAGVTVNQNKVIYTYAPKDTRHFEGVDAQLKRATRYLLSIPIPSIHQSAGGACTARNAGALQLLFEESIVPGTDVARLPQEFELTAFKEDTALMARLGGVFTLLPIVAFGIEVVRLRQTSYQAIHELKNKLISAQSWIDYLREDIKQKAPGAVEDETIRQDFELAESSVKEGAELAKTYLQFTKLYSPKFEPLVLNTVLAEVAVSMRALGAALGMEHLDVCSELAADIPERQMDGGQLKMAFFNLCKNAVEAMASSRVEAPKITLRSRMENGHIEAQVVDNGPGMPPEIASNLFVAFKTKKEGGTGLGLTITKKIIDIHGGTIRCDTGKGGTQFTVVF